MTLYSGDELYDDDVTSGPLSAVDRVAPRLGWVEWSEDDDCTWCGGEGYVECDDPIQCTRPHLDNDRWNGECECSACHGSGLAKDQTSW
jgi:hypothetical protein